MGLTQPGNLPDAYADALATDDTDAEEVAFEINADRRWQEAQARVQW